MSMAMSHAAFRGFGQTNPNFTPGVDSNSAGSALSQAGVNLLNYLDTNGVPSMHTPDGNVSTFQTAWNADPGNSGTNQQLSVDGEYGPNTHDALNAIVGGIAPAVNTGGGGGGGGGATPVPSSSSSSTTVSTASFFNAKTTPWIIGAAVLAGAALVYESAKHPIGKHARRASRGMHGHARKLLRRGHARRK